MAGRSPIRCPLKVRRQTDGGTNKNREQIIQIVELAHHKRILFVSNWGGGGEGLKSFAKAARVGLNSGSYIGLDWLADRIGISCRDSCYGLLHFPTVRRPYAIWSAASVGLDSNLDWMADRIG